MLETFLGVKEHTKGRGVVVVPGTPSCEPYCSALCYPSGASGSMSCFTASR